MNNLTDIERMRELRAQGLSYRAIGREMGRSSSTVYRNLNREKTREYDSKWRAANPEYGRKWRKKNPEYDRKWEAANIEKERERHRKWREENHEYTRKWRAANPEKGRANRAKRRAIKRKVTVGDLTAIARIYDLATNGNRVRCYLCGKLIPRGQRHVDHIIPLSKGGLHTASNLAIACAMMPEEVGILL